MSTPGAILPSSRERSPGGRRVAAALLTVLIGGFVGNAGRVVYLDTFTLPPSDPRDVHCAAGIHRLHEAYERTWAARQLDASVRPDPSLDRALVALRTRCAREGEAASAAYRRFERWRYRAESMALLWHETLADDVRAALAYQSPESHP